MGEPAGLGDFGHLADGARVEQIERQHVGQGQHVGERQIAEGVVGGGVAAGMRGIGGVAEAAAGQRRSREERDEGSLQAGAHAAQPGLAGSRELGATGDKGVTEALAKAEGVAAAAAGMRALQAATVEGTVVGDGAGAGRGAGIGGAGAAAIAIGGVGQQAASPTAAQRDIEREAAPTGVRGGTERRARTVGGGKLARAALADLGRGRHQDLRRPGAGQKRLRFRLRIAGRAAAKKKRDSEPTEGTGYKPSSRCMHGRRIARAAVRASPRRTARGSPRSPALSRATENVARLSAL